MSNCEKVDSSWELLWFTVAGSPACPEVGSPFQLPAAAVGLVVGCLPPYTPVCRRTIAFDVSKPATALRRARRLEPSSATLHGTESGDRQDIASHMRGPPTSGR